LAVEIDPKTKREIKNPITDKLTRIDHEEMTARIVRDGEIGKRITSHYHAYDLDKEELIAVAADF
jgi:hypothetical protein